MMTNVSRRARVNDIFAEHNKLLAMRIIKAYINICKWNTNLMELPVIT